MVTYIADAVEEADVDLTCFVVMDNHLHLVVRQNERPIGRFVQPILRRCALLVKRNIELDGHVFARRFQHRLCTSPRHLRTWISYVHRNPVKALLCTAPGDYEWSSYTAWANEHQAEIDDVEHPRITLLRDLFSSGPDRSVAQLCEDFRAYVNRGTTDTSPGDLLLRRRTVDYAGANSIVQMVTPVRAAPQRRVDLRDVVLHTISRRWPDLDIPMVRLYRGNQMRRIRRELVEEASRAGHSGREIATYLQMSESAVSRIVRAMWRQTNATSPGHIRKCQNGNNGKVVR